MMALNIGDNEYPFNWRNLCIDGRTTAANHEADGGLSATADTSVAAYSPLVEDVIDAPILTPELCQSGWRANCVDAVNGYILGIDSTSKFLQRVPTSDPTATPETVLDAGANSVRGVHVTTAGTWLATVWDGYGNNNGTIRRCANGSAAAGSLTWATITPEGAESFYPAPIGDSISEVDGLMAMGGYGIQAGGAGTTDLDTPVWISSDDGVTWTVAYTFDPGAGDANPFHVHRAVVVSPTTIYCSMGDKGSTSSGMPNTVNPFRPIQKLTLADGTWTATVVPSVGGEDAIPVADGKILTTCNGLDQFGQSSNQPVVALLDTATDTFEIASAFALRARGARQRRNFYDATSGLTWVATYDYGATTINATNACLMVTLDYTSFAVVCRFAGTWGGVHNFCGIDAARAYLYFEVVVADGTYAMYRVPLPTTSTVSAIRVKAATANILATEQDSTFNGGVGAWTGQNGGTIEAVNANTVADSPRQTGTIAKIVTPADDGDGHILSGAYSTFSHAAPAAGDYVMFGALVWTEDGDYDRLCVSVTSRYTPTNCVFHALTQASIGRTPQWFAWLGQYIANDADSGRMFVRFKQPTYTTAVSRTIYMDRAMWLVGTDPNILYRTWQNHVASTADVVTLPLGGFGPTGSAWSVRAKVRLDVDANLMLPPTWSDDGIQYLFGDEVMYEGAQYVCIGSTLSVSGRAFSADASKWQVMTLQAVDHPILTIMGQGTDNLHLLYNAAAATLTLTDGTHTITTDAHELMYRHDAFDIVITHDDGGNALLYVRDPLLGTQVYGAESGVVLSTAPSEVRFGTNAAADAHAEVVILGANAWQSTLTAGEVADVFEIPAEGFDTFVAADWDRIATTQAADAGTLTAATLNTDGTDTTVALGASTATIKSGDCFKAGTFPLPM
jgi:hypothetical protein